jgi:hypothetical protein
MALLPTHRDGQSLNISADYFIELGFPAFARLGDEK